MSNGTAKAILDAVDAERRQAKPDPQLSLLPPSGDGRGGEAENLPARPARGGRPPGSPNRRSLDAVRLVESRLGEPFVAALVRETSLSDEEIRAKAGALGCKPVEVWRQLMQTRAACLPFLAKKLGTIDDQVLNGLVNLLLQGQTPIDRAEQARVIDGDAAEWRTPIDDSEDFQGVDDAGSE